MRSWNRKGSRLGVLTVTMLAALTSNCVRAQNSGGGFELHANGNITAKEVGLPEYPGAKLFKDDDNHSALDMGMTFGDAHFRLVAASYVSGDSGAKVLDFYRRALAHYGDVLECDHGKPVGALRTARGGLTCGDNKTGHNQVNGSVDSSDDHELRAGTPQKFRIVGLQDHDGPSTRFGMVYLEIPKESDSGK